jgi:hypothetical protein
MPTAEGKKTPIGSRPASQKGSITPVAVQKRQSVAGSDGGGILPAIGGAMAGAAVAAGIAAAASMGTEEEERKEEEEAEEENNRESGVSQESMKNGNNDCVVVVGGDGVCDVNPNQNQMETVKIRIIMVGWYTWRSLQTKY